MPDTKQSGGITRELALDMLKDGSQARRDGKDSLDCPYSRNGDQTERFKAHWWTKGWLETPEGAAKS